MVHTADAMEVLARGRIIEVTFDEYVGTINGLFNVLEICGGFAMYLMLDKPEGGAPRLLKGTAYTFSFNGFFMVFSSILSATSAHYMPSLFYYVLFQATGSVLYIFCSISLVRKNKEVGMPAMVGLTTGGLHAFHCAYSTYKIYYENK
ncbi:uncharacterized protein LOC119458825 [Dermacentor silvarum]|uniref:uncharacterized protein LOC119458825 n=1 Tax=Dermacentor silvarum TaxID=543639 RepID=UPI0018981799|nr:uncharacterized protein LOC119458825 [Dermacentor silvarum]